MSELIRLVNGEIESIILDKDFELFYIREDEVDNKEEVGFYTNKIIGDDIDQQKISDKDAFILLANKL